MDRAELLCSVMEVMELIRSTALPSTSQDTKHREVRAGKGVRFPGHFGSLRFLDSQEKAGPAGLCMYLMCMG